MYQLFSFFNENYYFKDKVRIISTHWLQDKMSDIIEVMVNDLSEMVECLRYAASSNLHHL